MGFLTKVSKYNLNQDFLIRTPVPSIVQSFKVLPFPRLNYNVQNKHLKRKLGMRSLCWLGLKISCCSHRNIILACGNRVIHTDSAVGGPMGAGDILALFLKELNSWCFEGRMLYSTPFYFIFIYSICYHPILDKPG